MKVFMKPFTKGLKNLSTLLFHLNFTHLFHFILALTLIFGWLLEYSTSNICCPIYSFIRQDHIVSNWFSVASCSHTSSHPLFVRALLHVTVGATQMLIHIRAILSMEQLHVQASRGFPGSPQGSPLFPLGFPPPSPTFPPLLVAANAVCLRSPAERTTVVVAATRQAG